MRKSDAVSPPEKLRKAVTTSMPDTGAKVQVRLFGMDDMESILDIQSATRPTSAWRESEYERLAADPQGMILVAQSEARMLPEIVGFSVFYRMERESELWNIAVRPSHRRQGIARALLSEGCRRLAGLGIYRIFLEVRESNLPAVSLYYSFGFELLSRRKEYYLNPKEDALVLVHKLLRPGIGKT